MNLGEQLDAISRDLDRTTREWAAAGHPSSGPLFEAREAVFDRLKQWNKAAARRLGLPGLPGAL